MAFTFFEWGLKHFYRPFDYKPHDYINDLRPNPSKEDMEIYQEYVRIGRTAKTLPKKEDLEMYMSYLKLGKTPTKEDWECYHQYMALIEGK